MRPFFIGLRNTLLLRPRSAEQFRIDDVANGDGRAGHFAHRFLNVRSKRFLQPFLAHEVLHADDQNVVEQNEFRMASEPEIKAVGVDSFNNGMFESLFK